MKNKIIYTKINNILLNNYNKKMIKLQIKNNK